MSIIEGLIGPIAKLIDKIIPDPEARDRAKLELLKMEGSQEMEAIRTRMTAIVAEANSADPWTSRARPSFLYVMYALLLWAIPMGLIAAAEQARGDADMPVRPRQRHGPGADRHADLRVDTFCRDIRSA